ncbi:MAG: sulfite exporter TauE/SafE family protein [Formosa sp.]|nr:sulfite exporter TauE/SafE family protein [Formosa sp.]MDB2426746.1 sulfite exporter TauE/SafE family protein [Flavobacteriaceae bacterium]MDC3198618.1 sulfite exporter TauE/SafE family protein [Flavobacteriaceae bacterium]MDC3350846.1 sulfite exporter TauE/SafE family protein [Flavobacteriaceae bacterium]
MNYTELLGYFGALIIGLVVGLFGGGGSILAVPIFVYLFHLNPILATSYSLFVVGFSAAAGTIINIKKKLIDYRIAIIFSFPALFSVFVVRRYLISSLPEVILDTGSIYITTKMALMLLFSIVILLSSFSMLKKNKAVIAQKLNNTNYSLLLITGSVVGVLTGLVGAGGGFIIVPALVFFAGLKIKQAVATSLVIITCNALFGFLSDITQVNIDWFFLTSITLISVLGIVLGSYLSNFINDMSLKKNFARFILLIALMIICNELA